MPWKATFDTDCALKSAMEVFWEKGFEATSMSDLTDAMGINKGSLYNSFGGKRSLFVKVLMKYDVENRREVLAQFEALDDPLRSISSLFDAIIDESLSDKDRKGCLLVNTALELPAHDGEIRAIVSAGFRDVEGFFRRSIEIAKGRHEVSEAVPPSETAKALLTLVVGLRTLARGVFDESDLHAIKNQALALLSPVLTHS